MNRLDCFNAVGWVMTVERRPGIRLLIGKLPHSGVDVTVRNPWGDLVVVMSGSKPEYGPGGFEVPIWTTGLYTIRFLNQTFKVNIGDETVVVTFTERAAANADARLVSRWRPVEDARALWQRLQGMAEFVNLFSLEERIQAIDDAQGSEWRMEIDRLPGPRLIIGRFPEPSVPVVVRDPFGNETHLLSGSKPEHGPGGFEVPVWRDALYTICFLGMRFVIEVRNDTVFATFTRAGGPQGRLVSAPVPRSVADELLARLQEDASLRTMFAVEDAPLLQPDRVTQLA